jgi:hypothetical protein
MRKKIETIGAIFVLLVYMGLVGYLLFFAFMPPGFAGIAFASIAIWIFFLLSAASSIVVRLWTNHALAILLFWTILFGAYLAEGGIDSDWLVFLILFLVHITVQCLAAFVAERIRTEAEPGDAENGVKPLGDERTP